MNPGDSQKAEKFKKLSQAGNTARWNLRREQIAQLAQAGIDREEYLAALNRERVRRFRAKQLKGKKAA